ncbi:unnamed protein product [Urochloa humidicola]
MAKARRPPFFAAERFLGFPRTGSPGAVVPAPADHDLPDLAEANVWYSGAADSVSPCPAASRQVEAKGRTCGVQGGLSRAFEDGRQMVSTSAPIEVPAWPSRFSAVPDPEPAPARSRSRRPHGGRRRVS